MPFDQPQAEQIERFRRDGADQRWERTPRVSVSRSIISNVHDQTRYWFGARAPVKVSDQVGHLDGGLAHIRRSYVGEPEQLFA